MNAEVLLTAMLRKRKLGISLVLTGLFFIVFLFAGGLLATRSTIGPPPSCQTSPLLDVKTDVEVVACLARQAQATDKGLLLVPFAIAGGALVAVGAAVLLYPSTLRIPQRAPYAKWEMFTPRAELDLGPALLP